MARPAGTRGGGLGAVACAAFAMTLAPGLAQAQALTTQKRVGTSAVPPPSQRPVAAPLPTSPAAAGPRTLLEALAQAYTNNPTLLAERAKLRATDENVPQALAGWRPTIVASGGLGYAGGNTLSSGFFSNNAGALVKSEQDRNLATGQVTLTQPIYRGGRTRATTNRAENTVMAERARLIAQEEQTFSDTVTAYVNVIQTQQILQLNINNEQVLSRQLQATNDRFRVGEITRTDVAQAEAALSGAVGTRQTAEGNIATARAQYQRLVGYYPAADIQVPQPLALPVKTAVEAVTLAAANNPSVVAALFDDASAKDAVDVAYSALLPTASFQGQTFYNQNSQQSRFVSQGFQVTGQLSIPIYQGGAEYSQVRQARQSQQQTRKLVDDARRQAMQQATAAWETLTAARATAASTRDAIRANRVALEGVEREAIVGSRTTLDVLNAQQALLTSQVTLVQNLASLITASYSVASSVGRLTARDLNLPVALYDETAYYAAVRDRWSGTGDFATDQPGR